MIDFGRARDHMVDSQLHTGGVTEPRILVRMRALARENYVPSARRDVAYVDDIHWFGGRFTSRFMAAPATLARLLQLAEVGPADTVLDIGIATGYSTAVIAGLAASVVGVESDAGLAALAMDNLAADNIENARVISGPVGLLGKARFDVVVVQGALAEVPRDFIAALKEGGRLVALIGNGGVPVANVFVKAAGEITARPEFDAALPPLFSDRPEEVFVF